MPEKLTRPTDEEDAVTTAAALSDPDNPPLTDEQIDEMRAVYKPSGSNKDLITIPVDADILEVFRTTDPSGWTERINEALKDWVREHRK